MNSSEAQNILLHALQDYLSAVSAQKLPDRPDLIPHCQQLELLAVQLAPQLDPRLNHFLESKSYRKAHDYLVALPSSKLAKATPPRQACSS
jgi:hypothetical protein